MKEFSGFILSNEETLISKILEYAKESGYNKNTSTLMEAWRMSISGLSKAIMKVIENNSKIPGLGPDIDYSKNEIAEFGILEARKHRSRGITLDMFLGLMKYYQESYIDLIQDSDYSDQEKRFYCKYISRVFSHIELGFISEWTGLAKHKELEELQAINRTMTNEKNKYLTVFESLYDPVILLNEKNEVENMNYRAVEVFFGNAQSGKKYYCESQNQCNVDWMKEDLERFTKQGKSELLLERTLQTVSGQRTYSIKLKKMLDISEKYSGTVVVLYDITDRINTEKELKSQQEKLKEYAYKDTLTGVSNRRTGLINLKTELARIHGTQDYLSVCFLDLDGLKAINDTYGHAEGDNMIQFITATIKTAIRGKDTISRMGGDEFLILFPDCRKSEAENIILTICNQLEQYDNTSEIPYRHSFSYGIHEVSNESNQKVNDILKIVDEKMYQHKFWKKNR